MTVSTAGRVLMLAFLFVGWTGCSPISENESDEQKNPHFLTGRNRLTQMDYKGAIESFERALEANPRSASAHLELGLLQERMNDFAAAIYHLEKHLKLRPNSNVAQTVRDRIVSCKVELAKTVPFALVSQQVQAGLDKLTTDNAALRQQVDQLKAQLAHQAAQLTNQPTPAPTPIPPVANQPSTAAVERAMVRVERPAASPPPTNQARPASAPKTHVVRSGETLARISRMYGISLPALMAANPGIEPKRLRAGQTVQIPLSRN